MLQAFSLFAGVVLVMALGAGEASAQQQVSMDQILADPKLVVEHRDLVIQGYRHFADAERKYPAMQKRFQELGRAAIEAHNVHCEAWSELARAANVPDRAVQLNALTALLNEAVA